MSARVARVSTHITFGGLDEKILTLLTFLVSLVVTAAPFAVLGLWAQQANRIVGVLAAVVLAGSYAVIAFFLLLPWRSYRWLHRHRYLVWEDPPEPAGAGEDSAGRAAEEPDRRPERTAPSSKRRLRGPSRFSRRKERKAEPERPAQPRREPSGLDGPDTRVDHRARGIRVLNQLHAYEKNTASVADDDRHPRPLGIHRLAVNALLDDLHQTYGDSGPSLLPAPRRKRSQRPVLVIDQHRASRVERYLVRLIGDERLRRGFPDPLLIVQVRNDRTASLVNGFLAVDRCPALPEGPQTPRKERSARGEAPLDAVRRWHRLRYAAGGLGVNRLIGQRVPPPTDDERKRLLRRPEPEWVLTVPALVGNWAAGTVAVAAAAALLGVWLIPDLVQARHPCVQDGAFVPRGITRIGSECVGVTSGDFVFHDRLEEVTDLIHEQSQAVEEGDEPYVTVLYLGALDVADEDDPSLSGVQGELLGLAHSQERHNRPSREGRPQTRLLIANAGQGWNHAETVAEDIAGLVEDEDLGTDRPVAAVGFGHSVVPNSQAIMMVGDAQLPMVGSTATFDDVSRYGNREHSGFYFPIAPANSRIAAQAAHWAYNGVPWGDGGLEPARSAVALASVSLDEEGEHRDTYGPHPAQEFIRAFRAEGGRVWEPPEGLGPDEFSDGSTRPGSGPRAAGNRRT